MAAHDQQGLLNERQRTIQRNLHRSAPIDALVETWDMRQPVRLRQRFDDTGAPLQGRRTQPPIDFGQRHPHKIIITDRRRDLARRDSVDHRGFRRRQSQPLPDERDDE